MKPMYIQNPPSTIPCWYCGEPCIAIYWSATRNEYQCYRHEGIFVEVLCVQHEVEAPNWFFNRIAVFDDHYRLSWNFYSGNQVHLEHKKNGCWEWISLKEWPPKFKTYPAEFLNQSPEKLASFLKLYRVWS